MILKSEWFADRVWAQTIFGNPLSKANSRIPRALKRKNDTPYGKAGSLYIGWIKSKPAQKYVEDFIRQCRRPTNPIDYAVIIYAKVYWRSLRSDVEIELIKDALQAARVIVNDRVIRFMIVDGTETDGKHPRAEIELFRWLPGTQRKLI